MKNTAKYLQGGIEDVMVFPFALSAEEIKKLYNGEWINVCKQIVIPKPQENNGR